MLKLRNRRGEEVLSIQYEETSYLLCIKVATRTAIYRVTRNGNYFISGKESEFDVSIDTVMVIYHKGCADGVAAAWCFSRACEEFGGYGDFIYFHAGVYGDAPPDVTGMRVFLVDFSYHPDVVKEMCKTAESVTLLDHHISAIEALSIPMPSNFDMSACTINKSGCEIAWEFLFKDKTMPTLLQHIADRDLWKFNFQETKAVTTALFAEPLTIANIDKHIVNDAVDSLARDGVLLLKQHQGNVERIIKAATRRQWIGGYHVVSVNAPWFYASDIGDAFKDTEPFSASYYDTEESRIYSLRSGKDGIDVSKIATAYGGGGHKHAAGFKVARDHILART